MIDEYKQTLSWNLRNGIPKSPFRCPKCNSNLICIHDSCPYEYFEEYYRVVCSKCNFQSKKCHDEIAAWRVAKYDVFSTPIILPTLVSSNTYKKFLLLPKCLNGRTKWLCFVKWEKNFWKYPFSDVAWEETKWI